MSRVVSFFGPAKKARTVRLDVYSAVRVEEGLLVPVDLSGAGPGKPEGGNDYFCRDAVVCGNFGATYLVDPVGLVRYEALRATSGPDAPVLSSEIPFDLGEGVRYRAGVLFPLPDGAPSTVELFLQFGGLVDDLPIRDGPVPQGLLPARGSSPPSPAPSGSSLVVLPVRRTAGKPVVTRHPILARVVGGTLNQAAGTEQGVVSLAADVLFDFDSATLTPQSQAVVQQAAQILAEKAEPSRPVIVAGYTDSKGSDTVNVALSQRRAMVVADALRANSRAAALKLEPAGRGAGNPVAANTRPGGADDPAGRALNRRVELAYTPIPAPPPSPPVTVSRPPATPSGQPSVAPLATLSAPAVIAGGAGPVPMTATLRSVRRDGALTVTEVGVTPVGQASGVDYFAAQRNDRNVSSWQLTTPATGAVYVPAADGDNVEFVLGTLIRAMNGGAEYLITFWTAALPAELARVDVDLGQLGVAKDVPVSG